MKLTKLEFIDRFKPEEFATILEVAKSSVAIESWLFRFNNTTPDPDGFAVDLNDPRTVLGVRSMEEIGLIAPGRSNEILSSSITPSDDVLSFNGISVGDQVVILEPFGNSSDLYEVTRVIVSEDGTASYEVRDMGFFDKKYLEVK